MDIIKERIALRVSAMVCDTNWNNIVPPADNKVNEGEHLSILETGIRISTPGGPRHFVVKVKELY